MCIVSNLHVSTYSVFLQKMYYCKLCQKTSKDTIVRETSPDRLLKWLKDSMDFNWALGRERSGPSVINTWGSSTPDTRLSPLQQCSQYDTAGTHLDKDFKGTSMSNCYPLSNNGHYVWTYVSQSLHCLEELSKPWLHPSQC